MDGVDAEALADRIRSETGLAVLVGTDDGRWWLDVEVPPIGDEIRAVVTVHEPDDWPWLYETHVRHRLTPPASS